MQKKLCIWLVFSIFMFILNCSFAEGILTISDIQVPSPCVFKIPIQWNNNSSNISTLVIQWNIDNPNLYFLEAEPSTEVTNKGKKIMIQKTGQQLNFAVFGGTESIPDGVLAHVVLQITEPLQENNQISIATITASGADGKALPQDVSISSGKITIKNNSNYHTADTSKDWTINMSELLRVVQLFNAREYHCEQGTEDGYGPYGGSRNCPPHKSDYNPQNWKIQLDELLRAIQFFNHPGGSYHPDTNGEDKYAPGPFSK
ncbi:MAG TPA: cohesin domain-containing protein [Candidatus Hydrogenedens sp.]|nr:cohesin domain-containing protein [Candidatus Hydrogenedens sp.]HOL19036.1 cohesin domain-containing protein [Candidatus Hydrogenedens sp.]HPP57782.1 cohesin domain-containing protein [Candidatus Hydrogenedens sp.]